MDILVYGALLKKIKSAASGIENIYKDGHDIVFVMSDGTEFRITDEAGRDITDIDINSNNYIVITFDDGTTATSDKPIFQLMTAEDVDALWD